MISVPEAGILPSTPGTPVSVINRSRIDCGNPFGYVGNACCKTIPAISQWPVVVSLPFERKAHLPNDPRGSELGDTPRNGRTFPNPQLCKFGSATGRDSQIW